MKPQYSMRSIVFVTLLVIAGLLAPVGGYSQFQPGQKRIVGDGQELSVKGVILHRDPESITLRDLSRNDTVVMLTDRMKVRSERKWVFHGHRPFDVTVLIPGLIVTAKGKGSGGNLVADTIEFTDEDMNAAMTSYAQSAPIARQATENKKQIAANRAQISDTDRKLAETSKEVVDTNKRINELDQYDVIKTVTVLFPVNSAKLSNEGKSQLDDLASKAPGAKNYLVEVEGYADATGNAAKNMELSQTRADAVVQYLTVKHSIPLRRITMPMGYGESKASETPSPTGRSQERRVDVRVLVNKGLNR
jgi:outer membrane protein OmpA-like peptidoglycan-associated protein